MVDGSRYLLSNKTGCSIADQRRIDSLAATFFTLGRNARYLPSNYQELKPFCRELNNVSKSIENFMNRCYTTEVLQFAKIIFFTVNKQLRFYCGKRSKKMNRLFKMVPCINENLRTETVCIDQWLKDFSLLPNLYYDKEKIIYGCW